MPRVDPITGCKVMTRTEFWVAEGQREGRPAGEVRQDFYDQIAGEETKERQTIANDPLRFLQELHEAEAEANDPECEVPRPLEVLEVIKLTHRSGMSSSETHLEARCRVAGGEELVMHGWKMYWSGSMMEPPDQDYGIEVTLNLSRGETPS